MDTSIMISPPQEQSLDDLSPYANTKNHQQRNLILHNNRIAMTYDHENHQDNKYQQRYNESNNF